MITILDYGVGNVQSLLNMYDYLGIDAEASKNPNNIAEAQRLIIPGVGAFDNGMRSLNDCGVISSLEYAVFERQIPLLGICLGMQLLARRSDEGRLPGLGWIAADVKRLEVYHDLGLKIPHIGWSEIVPNKTSLLLPTEQELEKFYFVHGYHMVCDEISDVLATVKYGDNLCCAINKKNIWGVQFHPEKSHRYGMRLLSAFANLEVKKY